MDFLEIFTSGRYHRDMKILKILLASNSKRFRVYGIFKKLQIDNDNGRGCGGGGGVTKYNNFLDNSCLK